MSRYMRASQRSRDKEPTPPIWRGIGCLLALIVPLMSWILAYWTVEWARTSGWPLPYQMMGYVTTPPAMWSVPGLPPILAFIERQPHIYMTLLVTIAYVLALSGLMSVVYSFVYKIIGPPHLGPYDGPQPEIKVGRYKR